MKINGERPSGLTSPTEQSGKTSDAAVGGLAKAQESAKKADQLTLSSEAKFMQSVAEKANMAPAIRQEVVDRMKALLDQGGVGNDAGRLADSLIDDVLKQS